MQLLANLDESAHLYVMLHPGVVQANLGAVEKRLHVLHMTSQVVVILGKVVLITPPKVHEAAQVVAPTVVVNQASQGRLHGPNRALLPCTVQDVHLNLLDAGIQL
jgi:hypothetical protein